MSGTFDALDQRPHSVYQCYDASGQLLYVGCARNAAERIGMHMQPSSQSETSWYLRAHMARWDAAEYPTKAAAREAERKAIRSGLPLLNKQHNPRFKKTRAMRYAPASRLADTG